MKRFRILSCLMIVLCGLLIFSTPALAGAKLSPIENLGKAIYEDENLSLYQNQSCKTCHNHVAGFADPDNWRHPDTSVVSIGSDGVSKGGRNGPTSAYGGFSPILSWIENEEGRVYIGGLFWDGRATGFILGDPLAEQAQGPLLNPVEMAMPNKEAVIEAVRNAKYASLFLRVFGPDALDDVDTAFDYLAEAAAAYERSSQITKFSSKFDRFWLECKKAGIDLSTMTYPPSDKFLKGILNKQELDGLALFIDDTKGGCARCHPVTEGPDGCPPLFTDFTYDNLGIPRNPLLAGIPTDYGLGGFLKEDYESASPLIGDENYADQNGKFRVQTLRDIGKTPPYGHNGYFATLKDIIEFYNTRDLGGWPPPEVPDNVNTAELGNLGLSDQEVDAIAAFLRTLTDCVGMGRQLKLSLK
jgi:cytochrome c peroxidase